MNRRLVIGAYLIGIHLALVGSITYSYLLANRLRSIEAENQFYVEKYKDKMEAIASQFGIHVTISKVGDILETFDRIAFQVQPEALYDGDSGDN